jgi:hypothetical protein
MLGHHPWGLMVAGSLAKRCQRNRCMLRLPSLELTGGG